MVHLFGGVKSDICNLLKSDIGSRYIGISIIIGKIIDIDLRLLEIIGDFKSLSISLSLSKVPGKLSINY